MVSTLTLALTTSANAHDRWVAHRVENVGARASAIQDVRAVQKLELFGNGCLLNARRGDKIRDGSLPFAERTDEPHAKWMREHGKAFCDEHQGLHAETRATPLWLICTDAIIPLQLQILICFH